MALAHHLGAGGISVLSASALGGTAGHCDGAGHRLAAARRRDCGHAAAAGGIAALCCPGGPQLCPVSALDAASVRGSAAGRLPFRLCDPRLHRPSRPGQSGGGGIHALRVQRGVYRLCPPGLGRGAHPRPAGTDPEQPQIAGRPGGAGDRGSAHLPAADPRLPPRPAPPSAIHLRLHRERQGRAGAGVHPEHLLRDRGQQGDDLLRERGCEPHLLVLCRPGGELRCAAQHSGSYPAAYLGGRDRPLRAALQCAGKCAPGLPQDESGEWPCIH